MGVTGSGGQPALPSSGYWESVPVPVALLALDTGWLQPILQPRGLYCAHLRHLGTKLVSLYVVSPQTV